METLENTKGAVTKTDLRWRGACTHVPFWLRPWTGKTICKLGFTYGGY